jgi:DNA-binding beta-propeller fold protein YncE
MRPRSLLASAGALAVIVLAGSGFASVGLAAEPAVPLPTGQRLTPLAVPGASFEPLVTGVGPDPAYVADGAAVMTVSPDGGEMLVLTSGFNRYVGADGKAVPAQSVQYVFRYRIGPAGARLEQVLTVPNSYSGAAWRPDGESFVIGGGVDDNVHVFARTAAGFAETGNPIALGHAAGVGVEVEPQAAGVAVSPDGTRALVANYYNDTVSLIDLDRRAVLREQDLRPGKIDAASSGVAGGEYPFAILWRDKHRAYVSAPRDRQIVALDVTDQAIRVAQRIPTIGEPTAMVYDAAASRLYATEDNADRLAIVDTAADRLLGQPRLGLPTTLDPEGLGKGVNPNSLALTADRRLLITYGGVNALATVTVEGSDARVIGLVPTGWYPSAVATSRDGGRIFVANRKSPPGPNPQGCPPRNAVVKAQPDACGAANQYIFQLEKAGLLQFPAPDPATLAAMTRQVADNLGLADAAARATAAQAMARLRSRIRHVVFIVKENRTYDQLLGDLEIGNGDPSLAILGAPLSPNHHALARQFITLDNFYDSGEQSSTGWTWTTAGRVPDLLEKTAPVNYAGRGLAYEAEEEDRNIATALTPAQRHLIHPAASTDPDILPGPALLTAPDGDEDDEPGQGFLWNAAIRAGLSVRNYGFSDASVYDDTKPGAVPLIREPAGERHVIYTPADRDLARRSDPYFRGFDQSMPDYWRELEWEREFAQQEAAGTMPSLTLLRLSHDHFGNFDVAIDGVNTVETEMADNDYALGRVVERVAKSSFAKSTLIFVIEDDAQNGADHVDARRSIALVAGPYVRQHALVSTRYTTINLLRTIEEILGLKPMGINDALATPMTDLFDVNQSGWSYRARAANVLRTTSLPIPPDAFDQQTASTALCRLRSSAWWAQAMRGQDFRTEDHLDTGAFNTALWQGLGRGPEPDARPATDLRAHRAALLGHSVLLAQCAS